METRGKFWIQKKQKRNYNINNWRRINTSNKVWFGTRLSLAYILFNTPGLGWEMYNDDMPMF